MKVSKLHIDSYRHLSNIQFDFTYPEGHAKAGQPLDKICIIGQSATGKTGLLELLRDTFKFLKEVTCDDVIYDLERSNKLTFDGKVEVKRNNGKLIKIDNGQVENYEEILEEYSFFEKKIIKLINDGIRFFYLGADVISKQAIDTFNQNPVDLLANKKNQITIIDNVSPKYFNDFSRVISSEYFYEFSQTIDERIWLTLLDKILDYRKRFNQMASQLINKGTIADPAKLNKEYEKWAKENENPLVAFAEYFNPLLEKLNLEVDLVNTEYAVPIKSKLNDEVLPISSLSTGTKGLLLSLFPLFELDTTEALILVDEPERSLFPDMQVDLMGHYQRLAPDAQFVVATHSPFIAAAFEPEERFILYFDEKGKVAVRRGESPIGDDPNDMLRNDFKVDYFNEFGKKAYQQYLELKRKAAAATDTEKKKELVLQMAALGDKYNF